MNKETLENPKTNQDKQNKSEKNIPCTTYLPPKS